MIVLNVSAVNPGHKAAKIAGDYVVECIIETQKADNHWYGARFEPALPKLINMIYK